MNSLAVALVNGEVILTSSNVGGKFLGSVSPRPDLGGFKAYDDDATGMGTFPTLESATFRVIGFALAFPSSDD